MNAYTGTTNAYVQWLASFLAAAVRVTFPVGHVTQGTDAFYARCHLEHIARGGE